MAKGISTQGDVLVNMTADGVDLNEIWAEIQEVQEMYNRERSAVVQLLSYPTTLVADAVPQSISSDSMEVATEFGVPRAIRPPSDVLKLGYQFKEFDISLRPTWKFLRAATAQQVQAQVTRCLEADNKLVRPVPSWADYSRPQRNSTTGSMSVTHCRTKMEWCPRRTLVRHF
jgi:hypothetical protein